MEVSLNIVNSGYLVHGLMEKHFITVFRLAYVCAYMNYISEGSVSHINGVRPSFLENKAVSRSVIFAHATHVEQYACAIKLINAASW